MSRRTNKTSRFQMRLTFVILNLTFLKFISSLGFASKVTFDIRSIKTLKTHILAEIKTYFENQKIFNVENTFQIV